MNGLIESDSGVILNDLVTKVREGKCILFLGAGIHATPPEDSPYKYPEEQRPLLGRKLAEALAGVCKYEEKFPAESPDLQRVAQCYELTGGLGRNGLVNALQNHLEDHRKPSPALMMLADLPVTIFVTTNYDSLLETALRKSGRSPAIFVYDPHENEPTKDMSGEPTSEHPLIFKMHGGLEHSESIVITDEDYIQFVQRMSEPRPGFAPFPETVTFRMRKWPILFIGYSLRDYNFRLVFRTLRWHLDKADLPPAYSVDSNPDPLILRVWQDQKQLVTFVVQDIWKFLPWLYKEVMGKEYPP